MDLDKQQGRSLGPEADKVTPNRRSTTADIRRAGAGHDDPALGRWTRKRRWRRPAVQQCQCCGQTVPFCWHCRCGFDICQACMHDNVWGMSCNHITWQCPDCGELNGFGNQ